MCYVVDCTCLWLKYIVSVYENMAVMLIFNTACWYLEAKTHCIKCKKKSEKNDRFVASRSSSIQDKCVCNARQLKLMIFCRFECYSSCINCSCYCVVLLSVCMLIPFAGMFKVQLILGETLFNEFHAVFMHNSSSSSLSLFINWHTWKQVWN